MENEATIQLLANFLNIILLVVTGIPVKSFPHRNLNSWFNMYTWTLYVEFFPFKDYILKCPSSGWYSFLSYFEGNILWPLIQLDHLRYSRKSEGCVCCFQSQTLFRFI